MWMVVVLCRNMGTMGMMKEFNTQVEALACAQDFFTSEQWVHVRSAMAGARAVPLDSETWASIIVTHQV